MPSPRHLSILRSEVLLFLGAIVVIALVLVSQLLAAQSFERYHALVSIVSGVKQTVTESHIWLEERLSGDQGIDVALLIERPLALAAVDCRSILDGGASAAGLIHAITDPRGRSVVQALCVKIDDLHVGAMERLDASAEAGVGSALDTRFDTIFEEVIVLADESQTWIDQAIYEDRRDLTLISAGIVAIAAGLFLGLAVVMRRYRRSTEQTRRAYEQAGMEAGHVLVEAQREAQRAAVLNRLADRVTFAKGEADLVRGAVAALRRLVPSESGDVLLLNSSQDRLMVAASWGSTEPEVGRPTPVDSPDLCPGIRRGSIYALGDASDDLAVSCEAHPIDSGSLLCIPMLALGKSVGVIHLSRQSADAFDPSSQQLAARVAEQVALGLANARLMYTMERLAMTDALTGLNNARFFDPLVDRELAAAERDGKELAVLMIDVDNFKHFNDAHGHPGGDEALKAFAHAARGAIRESDTIARYGGEEFAVLVRDADLNAATAVGEKIRLAIEQTVVELGPNRSAKITVSVGVASTSAHGRDRMPLMRIADEALYRAKQEGRNRVVAASPSVLSPDRAQTTPTSNRSVRRSKQPRQNTRDQTLTILSLQPPTARRPA